MPMVRRSISSIILFSLVAQHSPVPTRMNIHQPLYKKYRRDSNDLLQVGLTKDYNAYYSSKYKQ